MSINSLWPSDTTWRQSSGSTLAQVMVCCLTAPSHYLNQCWLVISEVQWYSYSISHGMPQPPIIKLRLKIAYLKFHSNFQRGQWIMLKTGLALANGFKNASCRFGRGRTNSPFIKYQTIYQLPTLSQSYLLWRLYRGNRYMTYNNIISIYVFIIVEYIWLLLLSHSLPPPWPTAVCLNFTPDMLIHNVDMSSSPTCHYFVPILWVKK